MLFRDIPDGTILRDESGALWFVCTWRHGVRRCVPGDYSGGKTILIETGRNPEFTTAHPWADIVWTPDGQVLGGVKITPDMHQEQLQNQP